MTKLIHPADYPRLARQHELSELERLRRAYVSALSAYGAAKRIYPDDHPRVNDLLIEALHAKDAYYAAKVVWYSS